MQHTK